MTELARSMDRRIALPHVDSVQNRQLDEAGNVSRSTFRQNMKPRIKGEIGKEKATENKSLITE
jgi:hypothetical protein